MNKNEAKDRAMAKGHAELANLPHAGPLASKLPHLPVDYLQVVRDLNDSPGQLKGNWKPESVRNLREPYDIPELKYLHTTSLIEKSASFSYFRAPVLFVKCETSGATSRKRHVALVFFLGVRGSSPLFRARVYFT